jgi:hypothetical protein
MRLNKRLSRRQLAVLGFAAFATASGRRAMAQTVTYEQNANGQPYSYLFPTPPHTDSGNFPNNNDWSQSEVITTDGYGDQYESQPSNWSTPNYPNSSTVNVDLVNNTVTLDIFVTVGTLNINTGGVLNMLDNTALTVAGATLTNNGTINVNSNQQSAASDLIFSNGLLTGNGTVVLDYVAGEAQLSGALIQDVHSTIQGFGIVNAALTNNGTVNANAAGQYLYLQSSAMKNNSLFEATNGAVMSIGGISITQGTAGLITAATGSAVNIGGGASITGGTLSTTGGVIQFVNDGSTNTLNNVTNNGTLNILDDDTVNVTGNLTNNGVIAVNSNQAAAVSLLSFGGGTLGGTGTLVMNYVAGEAQLNGTLTQAAGHTIQGFGEINAALTNYGIVNANATGQILYLLNSGITNNSLIEATSGATLQISGIAITQGAAGHISSTTGSPVQVGAGSSIIGGTLVSSGSGQIFFPNDGSTNTLNGVTSNATLNILDADTVNVVGNLTDNATINVNSNVAAAASVLNFNGGSLLGSGTVTLDYVAGESQLDGTLTQASTHTIAGLGEINAVLTNSGIVNANVAGQTMYLLGGNKFNSATFEATNTATLSISGITINQTAAGQIEANGVSGNASVVQVSNSTLSGGTLSSSAGGYFLFPNDGTTSNLNSINNQATLDMLDASNIDVNGNLANSGTIIVNGNTSSAIAALTFNGGTVSGPGTIILNYVGGYAQLDGTLTQSSGHTIQGFGQINANLTNNGLVNANNAGGNYLEIDGASQVNTATIEATNGGLLILDSGGSVNNAGGKIVANGGNVDLENGTTISGGTLTATAPSFFDVVNNGSSGYAASFDGFTIAGGTTIILPDGSNLNVTSAQLTNNGTIVVNSNQSSAASVVNFNGGTLAGTGNITLDYSNPYAQISGVLTQAATHTIQGWGQINAALTNLGLVDANVNGQTLYLTGNNMNNSATFEATNGGTLDIDGITVNQTATAQIAAVGSPAPAGLVTLFNATISGGILNSPAGSYFVAAGIDTLASLTNNATVLIPDGDTLNVNGTLTDNGAIVVNSNQQSAAAVINFNGANLTGTGAVILQYYNPYAQLSGTLTQFASHTIEGFGVINAALTNLGLVNANATGQILYLTGNNMNNSATFESTNGGTLNIYGNTVNQSPTAQISAGGTSGTASYVTLTDATISGGILNSSPASSYFLANGTDTLASLTNNATILIPDADNVNVTGNLIDNGVIVINSNEASAVATLNFSGGTLSGNGIDVLQYVGGYAQINGTLTQATSHTIEGFGEINAALTNLGLVNANANGQTLYLSGNMSNTGTFEATNGGTLSIAGITVSQGAAGQIVAGSASAISVSGGAIISGGILSGISNGSYNQSSGTATFNQITGAAALNISGGLIAIAPGGGTSQIASLNLSGAATLDITNNKLVVNFGAAADPAATIRGYLQTARNGGVWTGTGLTSSTVKAQVAAVIAAKRGGVYGIGYVDGSVDNNQAANALIKATGNQIVYTPALVGDANLDGSVTFIDLGIVAQNLGAINSDWEHGDFNYDGTTNFLDIGLLAQNLNFNEVNTPLSEIVPDPSAALTAQWNLAVAEVRANSVQPADLPEPGMIGLLAVGAGGLLVRRRRR